jgi:glycosyltransferase involved in cell wall biosynthesis
MKTMQKEIVISAANITSGGPLTIYSQFLVILSTLASDVKITAFVSDKRNFAKIGNINFIELKWYKRVRFLKFYYEYFYYWRYSRNRIVDLWISLSDCSPKIKSKIQIAYFHNALPTHQFGIKEIYYSPKLFVQKYYSRFFFQFNIKANSFVIVQQNWYKTYIHRAYAYEIHKIIVCPPKKFHVTDKLHRFCSKDKQHVFVCPTKPVFYKNTEIIFKAVSLLSKNLNYRIIITIKGDENRLARMLYKKYFHLSQIEWLGQISTESLNQLYLFGDTLLWPSKLESWGLPLSEAEGYNMNIICADLPYAHETLSDYSKVSFFYPDDPNQLASLIEGYLSDNITNLFNTNKKDAQPSYDIQRFLRFLISEF